jgi:hypothetical protein
MVLLATLGGSLYTIRPRCLWAQLPQIITVIPLVASVVPARAPPLPPPMCGRFRLSTHRQCPSQVPLLGLCRVPIQFLTSNRRGRRKPMLGGFHRRPFRAMLNFRAVTDRLVQALGLFFRERPLLYPDRFLKSQLMRHPHTWPRFLWEQHPISHHTAARMQKAYTFCAGNDKEGVVFHIRLIHFFRVSQSAFCSHPYSVFTCADDFMSHFSLAFFPTILHHKGPLTYLCINPSSLFTPGPKDNPIQGRHWHWLQYYHNAYFARMEMLNNKALVHYYTRLLYCRKPVLASLIPSVT